MPKKLDKKKVHVFLETDKQKNQETFFLSVGHLKAIQKLIKIST